MYFVYVLLSLKDKKFYIGFTYNVEKRLEQHNNGESKSTRPRRPFELVYYEGFKYKGDAINQELFYKSSQGRRMLKSRLKTVIERDKSTRGAGVANRNRL
ncbi:hypothetical protein A2690_03230 [Candidatus Roizmanbacteria bacterium RIFCSPHIGHO2_01_FULL_39_12b]|uniref:GIY-YIG domain-containing protein n=1 Tax=Candidatus Roizmanbacteria bacterium RIFCSPHIGHO2_01_FULL_39_12b TaxID=1802030 RepID=A0A1F7GDC1_9BACT|nr:MAG: hypothetical protein A2690_03230 [Candidatus Roizmanbacteria bacterium RIFCSPHIGHO2_01_FULL_39_12b]OGK46677.1 MAG: hypothetical protein A3B46_02485 [Candidatus Roizmanbacteria bacterium RIFCSPLOWO2_01_FULL_39_19]